MAYINRLLAVLGIVVLAITASVSVFQTAHADEHDASYQTSRPLYAGWNLIAWPDGDSTVHDLRQAVPGVSAVHRLATIRSAPERLDDDSALRRGAIYWVRVDGSEEAANWRVGSDLSARRFDLESGINLVPWMGRDSVQLSDVTATRHGSAVGTFMWDAVNQVWRHLEPEGMAVVRTGDVLIVHALEPSSWVLPTGVRGNFEFGPSVTDTQRRAVAIETATIETTLAQNFAFHPASYTIFVATTWRELSKVADRSEWSERTEGGCPPGGNTVLLNRSCSVAADMAFDVSYTALHATFDWLEHWAPREGWSLGTWLRNHRPNDASGPAKHERTVQESRVVATPIDAPSDADLRPLWYLWTDWLIQQFGGAALVRYLRQPQSLTSYDAYHRAFGQTEEELYRDFAHYRSVVAPPIARDGDRILLSGAEVLENEQQVRQTIANVEQFFLREFSFSPDDIIWQVTSIEGSSAENDCGLGSYSAVFVGASCFLVPSVYAHEYFHHMQQTWGTLEPNAYISGPEWEVEGQAHYWDTLFGAKDDETIYESARSGWVADAAMASAPALNDPALANLDHGPEYWLGALAAEMLASIAGRHAIRDWYAAMVAAYRDTQDFEIAEQRAFRETYGISLDEFYERFAAWRAEGFPPLAEGGVTP